MNIGVDFGSTYSVVSKYNPTINTVEAISFAQGEPSTIPSVVSINRQGRITTGKGAKEQAGKKTVRIFEGFKILLTEENQEMLRRRGYDGKYTPREVTRIFLESTLKGVLSLEKQDRIDNLVICVPEIWSRSALTQYDGRIVLRDILTQGDFDVPIGHVRVVTEPEAASAYFAYHYREETGKSFNGHLLLIDYGGGTLDITLTEVNSDEDGRLDIRYVDGGGAGENHYDKNGNGSIGSAGIAYMQAVVESAMRDAGILKADEYPDYASPDFISAVRDLESQLTSIDRIKDIAFTFGSFGSYSKMKDILQTDLGEDNVVICLEYDGDEVPVTYQQLFRAYQSTIEGVLKKEVEAINQKVEKYLGSDPRRANGWGEKDFKIALVGGFGCFYLVKAQLAKIYNLDTNEKNDPRTSHISTEKQVQAISLGAALLAAGKVTLRKTARYSIGLCSKDKYGQPKGLSYGIKYHQDIEPGTPYFLCRDDGSRQVWSGFRGNIESLAVECSEDLKHGWIRDLNQEMLNNLLALPEAGMWYCGFSLDENDIVSIHLEPWKPNGKGWTGSKPIKIPLDNYTRMFVLAPPREVTLP